MAVTDSDSTPEMESAGTPTALSEAIAGAMRDAEAAIAPDEGGERGPAEADAPTEAVTAPDDATEASADLGEEADSESADTSAADAEGDQQSTDDGKDAASAAEPEPKAEADKLIAPQHWPEADRELFSGQSREVQDYLIQRNRQFEQQISRTVNQVSEIRQAIAPVEQEWTRNGVSTGAGLKQLIGWHQFLQQDPQKALPQLAHLYGVDLSAAQAPAEPGDGEDFVDPQVTAVQQELIAIQQQLARQSVDTQQQQQQAQASHEQQLGAQVAAFQNAKDDDGRLMHPYFDRVAPDMEAFVRSAEMRGVPLSLDQAYERAVRADPDLGPAMVDQQVQQRTQASQVAAKTDREAAVKKARANRNIGSSPPAGRSTGRVVNSVSDAVTGAMQKHGVPSP